MKNLGLMCLLSMVLIFMFSCKDGVEVQNINYINIDNSEEYAITAVTLTYYGKDVNSIEDLDLIFYCGVSYSELDSIYDNVPLDNEYQILYFTIGTNDSLMLPNGSYPLNLDTTRVMNTISFAEYRNIPKGGFGGLDPSQSDYYQEIISGTLNGVYYEKQYSFAFEGKTKSGKIIHLNYQGYVEYRSIYDEK